VWVKGIRGGNWNNSSNAGVFALNLNNARSIVNNNVGFRPACACVMFLERMSLRSASSVVHRQALNPCRKAKIGEALCSEYG
jgi:hypothetical protein